MHSNGNTGHYPHPPDLASIMLDQTRELRMETREQSHMLGWIMAQLRSGSEVHRELKADVRELKADVALLKASAPAANTKPVKINVTLDSIAGLLHAGRPYLFICAAVAGKLLGLGPSWIEPLAEKVVSAL